MGRAKQAVRVTGRGLRARLAWALAAAVAASAGGAFGAGPAIQVQNVAAGRATFQQNGSTAVIRQLTDKAIVNYRQFDVPAGSTVQFLQPSRTAMILNRINTTTPSQLNGTVLANGVVYFSNPSGIIFGPNSVINVGNIYAAAGTITDANFLRGANVFTGVEGQVINRGSITGHEGVNLIGAVVGNYGSIVAERGVVRMASGKEVYLGEPGSAVMVKVQGEAAAPAGGVGGATVENAGTVRGEAVGMVSAGSGDMYGMATTGLAVRNTGAVRAQAVRVDGGSGGVQVSGRIDVSDRSAGGTGGTVTITGQRVALVGAAVDASGTLGGGTVLVGGGWQGSGPLGHAKTTFLDAGSVIRADALGNGDGGRVVLWSDAGTGFYGSITARGGALGGNGGWVETSSKGYLDIAGGRVNTSAALGQTGLWLLDPFDVTITNSPTTAAAFDSSGGLVSYTSSGLGSTILASEIAGYLDTNNVTIVAGGSSTQSGNIAVLSPISVGTITSADRTLTLAAGTASGNITISAPITDGDNVRGLSVVLLAPGGTVTINAHIDTTADNGHGGAFVSQSATFTQSSGAYIATGDAPITIRATGGSALSLGTMTGSAMMVTAGAALNQWSGARLNISGSAGFDAGTAAITLDTAANDIGGAVRLTGSDAVVKNAAGLVLGVSSLSGALGVVTTGGDITQTGAVRVGGTASFSAGAHLITLDDAGNTFGGVVGLANSGNNDVTLVANSAVQLGAVSVAGGGKLEVTAAGSITQTADGITVTGDTSTFTVTAAGSNLLLASAANDFANQDVIFAVAGAGTVQDVAFRNVALTAGLGHLTLPAGSFGNVRLVLDNAAAAVPALTATGWLEVQAGGAITQGGALNVTGSASFAAGANAVVLTNAGNHFGQDVSLSVSGSATAALFNGAHALTLGNVTLGTGTLTVRAGSISQALGTVLSGSGMSFTATDGGNISLGNAGNSLAGPLTLTATNSGSSAFVVSTGAVALASATVDNGLVVQASGAITQSGAVRVGGTAGWSTGGAGAIALGLTSNSFGGAVTLSTGGGAATLHNGTNAVTLGTVALGAGGLDVTGGGISQAGGTTITAGGTAGFHAGAGALTLNQANALSGAVSLFNTSTTDAVTLVNGGAVALGTVQVAGTLNVTAGGSITQSGAVTATANASNFTAGPGADILLASAANDFGNQAVTFAAASGNLHDVAFRNDSPSGSFTQLTFPTAGLNSVTMLFSASGVDVPALTLTGSLVVECAGAITQSGPLVVNGSASFATGAAPITLADTGNLFAGAVSLSNSGAGNGVVLVNGQALVLGNVTTGGTMSLLAGGDITQLTGTTIQASGSGAVFGVTSASASILLATGANNFGDQTVTFTSSGVGASVQDVAFRNASTAGTFSQIVLPGTSVRDLTMVLDNLGVDISTLGGLTITGTLSVTAGQGITQSGPVTVAGPANFGTGASGSILLGNPANSFGGAVGLSATGTGSAVLTNSGALVLGASNLGTGTLDVTAGGDITQTGAIVQEAGAGAATFTTTGGTAVLLGTQANAFTGPVTMVGATVTDVSLRNKVPFAVFPVLPVGALANVALILDHDGLTLPALSVGGNLVVSVGGVLQQSGPVAALNLTTSSVGGTLLGGPGNQVGSYSATDIGAGSSGVTFSNTMGVLWLQGVAAATGDITVTNTGSLGVSAPVTASAGAVSLTAAGPGSQLGNFNLISGAAGVTFAADQIFMAGLGGTVSAGTGQLAIGPWSPMAWSYAASGLAGSVGTLTEADLATVVAAGSLKLGNATTGLLTIDAPLGAGLVAPLGGAGGLQVPLTLQGTGITFNQTVTTAGQAVTVLGGSGDITDAASGSYAIDSGGAGTVTLVTSGNVQSGPGPFGHFRMNVGTLDTSSAGGQFNVANGTALAVTGTITATGSLWIGAAGDLDVTATVTGYSGTGGIYDLVLIANGGQLRVAAPVTNAASGGWISLVADTDVLLNNHADVQTTGPTAVVGFYPAQGGTGLVAESGNARVISGTLGVSGARGGVTLNGANVVSAVNISNAILGDVSFHNSGALTVQQISNPAGAVTVINTGGTISLPATQSGITGGGLITLRTLTSGDIDGGATASGSAIVVDAAGGIGIGAALGIGTGGGTVSLATGGAGSAGSIYLSTPGAFATSQIVSLTTDGSAGKTISLATGGTLTVDANLGLANAALALTANTGDIEGSTGGTLSGTAVSLLASAGGIGLVTPVQVNASVALAAGSGGVGAAGNIAVAVPGTAGLVLTTDAGTVQTVSVYAGGPILVDTPLNTADVIGLFANGSIGQTTGATITAVGLITSSVGGTVLTENNALGGFGATNTGGGDITLVNTAPTLAVGAISQTGGGNVAITQTGALTFVGGNVTVTGTTGSFSISVTGLTTIGATVSVTTGGTILLETNDLQIDPTAFVVNSGTPGATVTIRPLNPAQPITIGADVPALGLTFAELGRISTGTLIVGNAAYTGPVTVGGSMSTPGMALIFANPVIVSGAAALDTTGGGAFPAGAVIDFQKTVEGTTAGADSLTLTAGTAAVTFQQTVGATTYLGPIDVVGAGSFSAATVVRATQLQIGSGTALDGPVVFSGPVTTFAGVSPVADGSVTIRLTGTGSLQIASGAPFSLAGGFAQTGDVAVDLNDDILTQSGAVSFAGPVTLTGGARTINTTVAGAGAGITFGSTVTSTSSLLLTAGAGLVTLGGSVDLGAGALAINGAGVSQTGGAITATSLELSGTGTFDLTQAGNQVGTLAAAVTGALSYTGSGSFSVGTLGATIGLSSNGGTITLTSGGTIQLDANVTAGAGAVVLQAPVALGTDIVVSGASVTLGGAVTGAFSLTASAAGGSILLQGDVTAANLNFAGPVTLGADVTVSSGGTVLFGGAVDSDAVTARSLTGSGTVTFLGALGSVKPLSALNWTSGAVALNGGIVSTTAGQTYVGAVTLGADTVLTGTAIQLAGGVNSDATARRLTINNSGNVLLAGAGVSSRLQTLSVSGATGTTTLSGSVFAGGDISIANAVSQSLGTTISSASGNIIYGGNLALTAGTGTEVLFVTNGTASGAGNITVLGTIQGTGTADLTLRTSNTTTSSANLADVRIKFGGDITGINTLTTDTAGAVYFINGAHNVVAQSSITFTGSGYTTIPGIATVARDVVSSGTSSAAADMTLRVLDTNGTITFMQNAKYTVPGNLTLQVGAGTGGTVTVGDLSALNNIIVQVGHLVILNRSAAAVQNAGTDLGADFVAGGTLTLPSNTTWEPGLLSPGTFRAATNAGQWSPDMPFDVAYLLQQLPPVTIEQFILPNGVSDLNAQGISGTSLATSLAGVLPQDIGLVIVSRGEGISASAKDALREMGIFARDLTPDENVSGLLGFLLSDDSFKKPGQPRPQDYKVASNRLPLDTVAPTVEVYQGLFFEPDRDAQGKPIVDSQGKAVYRLERDADGKPIVVDGKSVYKTLDTEIKVRFEAAWKAYTTNLGEKAVPAGFREFLRANGDTQTLANLDQLRDLIRQIQRLGLTPAEFGGSRTILISRVRPANATLAQFTLAVLGEETQVAAAK